MLNYQKWFLALSTIVFYDLRNKKNIFPGFFWIEILKIVIFSLFSKFRSRGWIDSWQNFKNDSFMFLCVLLCFVHDMDTIWIDLIKYRSLNSVDLSLPFKRSYWEIQLVLKALVSGMRLRTVLGAISGWFEKWTLRFVL